MTSLVLTALFTLFFIGIVTATYYFSLKSQKLWFFACVAVIMLSVQWLSDLGSSIVFQGYYLHLASIILFPSILVSLFFAHVFQGASHGRQLFFLLVSTTLTYMGIILLLSLLGNTPSYLSLDGTWFRNHLFSLLAVIADFAILTFFWPLLHNKRYSVPIFLKVSGIFWLILIADSLVFTLGAFFNSPELIAMIKSNLITRTLLTVLIAPAISFYLEYQTKSGRENLSYSSWDDVFNFQQLTLEVASAKQKIQSLEQAQAELERYQATIREQNQDLEKQRKAILNILNDVEKAKQKAEKNAQELEIFKLAVDNTYDHVIIADREGKVIYANSSVERITGFNQVEVIGKKAGSKELWGGLMGHKVYEDFWCQVKIDKKSFVGEFTNHRKNGEEYIAEARVSPILDKNGEVIFFVGIERDITKAKEIDRMKTDFISLASHQLRTPLSAMKWFLEMLLTGDFGKLTSKQKDAVNNINLSNEQMIELVNSLLNISRIESGRIIVDPVLTDIKSLIDSVKLEVEEKFIRKKQVLSIKLGNKLPQVKLDPKLIRQVLLNLLTNANKYTGNNGKIELIVTKNTQNIEFQVIDNGLGIPKKDFDKIFHRFYRASNIRSISPDGTGLGLYLVKAIVESSGGRVWFESQENKGTSFWFTIPITGMSAKKGEVSLN